MTTALIVFTLTFLAIAGQRVPFSRIDRPGAALAGAVAMVATGVLTLDQAYQAVNLDTIALLLGMMIVTAYLVEAAFFRQTAWWVLTRARSARTLLWALVFVSGGLSALLINDTVCLMFTPLVVAVVTEARLPPLPYLLALATGANVGGAVTFTGNPQNMIVGMAAHGSPSYLGYLAVALPAGLVAITVDALVLDLLFRKQLPAGPLAERAPPRPPFDRAGALKGLAALALFVGLAAAGFSLAGAAMTAAAALLIGGHVSPRQALLRVDWILLVFFAGLFVVVHGLASSGALERLRVVLEPLLARGDAVSWAVLAGLTVIGSNIVSNVPFVLVAVKWVAATPEPRWGFIVLAFSSTLAGNLTLVGSVANLIVFEGAGHAGRISFVRFLRYGSVVTLLTLGSAMAVLGLERAFLGP